MLLDQIILTCKLHIKDERSIAAVYYLLIGEKAIQTVQDAHIYNVQSYYGIYKDLHKHEFDQKVKELVSNHFLIANQKEENLDYQLTEKAHQWLKNNDTNKIITYFNGLQYERIGPLFLKRLFLLIQVLTNSKMRDNSYIPVIDNQATIYWMKKFYKKMKPNLKDHLQSLNNELSRLLRGFPEQEAEIFVDRLTGYKTFGLSIDQLSIKYNIDKHALKLLFVGMSHHMLDRIKKDLNSYPLLTFIINDLKTSNQNKLTKSAQITNGLLNNGRTAQEISQLRNLKINTIYDHIVEIAIYDSNFPINQYIQKHDKEEIIQVLKENKSFKLKQIKLNVHEDISYFQIRLVLATINNESKIR